MCVQDIRIGRNTFVVEHHETVLDGSFFSLQANPNRLGFMVMGNLNNAQIYRSGHSGDQFWAKVVFNNANTQAPIFRVETYGQLITEGIDIYAQGGNVNFTIIELIATPEVERAIQRSD